ncbi:fibronectin type III domain-containing protein [Aquimarina sp. W85]|uniref:fibronectin type III domain-containing protein n=1 Tax=Aquimarina rhodophyticola TaxID=3342246 RepID=UPI00366F68B9
MNPKSYNSTLRIVIITLLSFTNFCSINAQRSEETVNEIKTIARYTNGKVDLRWAPTSPSAWLKLNKFGYTIERFTISKNGKLLGTPERKELTSAVLVPDPIATWESIVNQNDYAAVLAQALYGEGFVVEEMQGGVAQIINKAKEIEQRFSFALFAADLNFEAARKAALGFVDTTVVPNEEYLYRINSKVPSDILVIKMGLVSVKTTKTDPLPSPIDLFAVPQDKSVMLTWEYQLFKSIFTSYFIERSEDGTNFKRLGDTPLVNMNDKPGNPSKRMFYVDTIAQNDKKYWYRVKGLSPFGEESPPSEVVSVSGVKGLEEVPHISRHFYNKDGSIQITWDFAKEAEKQIKGFQLHRAAQEQGPYKLVQDNISAAARSTVYPEPDPSNYFTITAVGQGNQRTTSFSAFVQTIDSIPPAIPKGLIGVVDTLGVVQLKWDRNTEKDLLGYRVFRGNLKKEEVSQLTIHPIDQNSFIDTVQVKSLTSKVFYQVVAVDQRFNMSEYSEQLALQKPDVVPPSSPIFSNYNINKNGIELQWVNSTSDDVVMHQLYRQKVDESSKGWQLIFKTDTIANYFDKKIEANTKYRYAVFAKDQAGLQSLPSTPITAVMQGGIDTNRIKMFRVTADRLNKNITLTWNKFSDDVTEIKIYKAKKDEKPVLLKQFPRHIHELVDISVSPGNVYVYQLIIQTQHGDKPSTRTEEVIF